ncbi:hypothetical protein D1816_01700 [Aquimarina sp. AD10]|uniref:hypothetical protein n=1 Tax=Aquimarina sp. AD10 TaxID=1714849 RepID=UPI000E4A5852|nr:hypothetical protein [Aquimarina sp. AD10]AXT59114.1 hypothetical protein D1816_01700 [Aquimarina sp. AD10]RKM93098.1 hypothetical protein D7033_20105 [Aquimarina sp. AD10]
MENLETIGVQKLDSLEVNNINGGDFGFSAGLGIAAAIVGFVVAWDKAVDAVYDAAYAAGNGIATEIIN